MGGEWPRSLCGTLDALICSLCTSHRSNRRAYCAGYTLFDARSTPISGPNRANSNVAEDGAGERLAGLIPFSARFKCVVVGASMLLCFAPIGMALEPSTPLASYGRQAWGMENGLPQNTVQALVQTKDGFVWLGTEVGLVRFDGNSFRVFDKNTTPALPGNDVRCLLAAKDGALWIGTSEGLARMNDGSVTSFTTKDGLPGNNVQALFVGNSGNVAAVTENGIGKIQDGHASLDTVIYEENVPGPLADYRFRVSLPQGHRAYANATTLAIEQGGGRVIRFHVGAEIPGTRIQLLYLDRADGLWIGTNGGLARWAAGKLERLP